MKIRFLVSTYVLLALLMVGLIVNSVILVVIIIFDILLASDVITVTAILLLGVALVGIFSRNRWGAVVAIAKSIFDAAICLIYFTMGITGSLLIPAIVLALASKEYLHLGTYQFKESD